ncbi:hypothetical protein ACFRAU_25110 [Arthrobacter sp. NPDC056691]|uniref:hypothetical protein n=1 Tax=Arthrobacter sp. NPDC056691 TaxID=3345913 RepID=UPI00366B8ACA
MAISAGFLARAFHRNPAPPALINLLPAAGKDLRARVEPRLAELVGTVVASLRAAGLTPIAVTDPRGRRWPPAYVLGRLDHDSRLTDAGPNMAVAEIVLDGSGRLVRNHPVQVGGSPRRLLPVSCPSIADRYEQFILAARNAEEPRGDALAMTRHGDLIIAGPGQQTVPLADYLHDLARSAAVHTR